MSSSSVRAAVAATEVTHARPPKRKFNAITEGSCPTPRPGGQKRARTKKAAVHVDSDFTPVAAVALSSPQPFQGNDSQGAFGGEDADNAEDAEDDVDEETRRTSYVNMGAIQKSSAIKQLNSAKKHFMAYLEELCYDTTLDEVFRNTICVEDLDALPTAAITEDLVGKFASYLMSTKLSRQSTMNYLSALKNYFISKHPSLRSSVFASDSNGYYSKLTFRVRQAYADQALATNTPLQEGAPCATVDDLILIANRCIEDATSESFQHRCFFIWLFHLLGRASEMVAINYNGIDVDVNFGCLSVSCRILFALNIILMFLIVGVTRASKNFIHAVDETGSSCA